uniref:Ntox44 domain-containing protein n=1 Tax=Parastrongyloides trichosuri TaxID=131310 RepID=A0A0N4ZEB6_PARTI
MICKDPSQNGDNYIPCDIVDYNYNDSYIIAKQQYYSDCYQGYQGEHTLEKGSYYYWIIKLSVDSLIGPLTKLEFEATRKEVQQQNGGFWDRVVEAHKTLWNSPLARAIVPDKISIGMGAIWLRLGKEPGVYLTPTFNVNAGYGAFVSGGFDFTASYYTGNPQDITASMLQGHTFGGMVTGGYLGSLSIGGSYSPTTSNTGFINGSVGFGLGYGVFIGGQYQYTPGYGSLW